MAPYSILNTLSSEPKRSAVAILLLSAAILTAYWPLQNAAFIQLDDREYVVDNPHVSTGISAENAHWAVSAVHSANWHPLTWLSHMLDVELFALAPGGHHLTSLLLHITNAILLFYLLRAATGVFWRSLLVASLFGLHPINVESVAWISERKNVLSTFFWLLASHSYLVYTRRPGIARFSFVFVSLGFGLMSKPMLVTLPFVLLLLDYWPLQRHTGGAPGRTWRPAHLVVEKLPLFALALASIGVTLWAQHTDAALGSLRSFPAGGRIANAAVAYGEYLLKVIWPVDLAVYYPYPDHLASGAVISVVSVLAGITIASLLTTRQYPWLAVGWLWFLGTLVPVIGLVQVGSQGHADRYAYVPGIGVAIIAAWGVAEMTERWSMSRIPAVVFMVCCAATLANGTRSQAELWTDGIKLFRHTIAVTERNFVAEDCLGNEFLARGMYDSAETHFSASIRNEPRFERAYYNRGLTRYYLDKRDSALVDLRIAVSMMPRFADACQVIGWIHRDARQDSLAEYWFRRAVDVNPGIAEAHNDLGLVLLRQDRLAEAQAAFHRTIALLPTHVGAHANLAEAYGRHGRPDLEIRAYLDAVRQAPGHWELYNNLALALARAGRDEEAIKCFDAALALAPAEDLPRRNRTAAIARLRSRKGPHGHPQGSRD